MLTYSEIIKFKVNEFKPDLEENIIEHDFKIIKEDDHYTLKVFPHTKLEDYGNIYLNILELVFGFDDSNYWITCNLYFYKGEYYLFRKIFDKKSGEAPETKYEGFLVKDRDIASYILRIKHEITIKSSIKGTKRMSECLQCIDKLFSEFS